MAKPSYPSILTNSMFDAYLLFIKDYKITKYITFTPSQSKQENYFMFSGERYLSAEKDNVSSSSIDVLYIT